MQGSFVKAKIEQDMLGKTCLMPMSEETLEDMKCFGWGEPLACKIYEKVHKVSEEYFRTYWACCGLVSENYPEHLPDHENWDTKEKVDEQIKIKCRYIKGWMYYDMSKKGT